MCVCTGVTGYDTSVTASSVVVDMGAVASKVLSDFLATMRTARTLNLQTIAKNIVVFVTIGRQGSVLRRGRVDGHWRTRNTCRLGLRPLCSRSQPVLLICIIKPGTLCLKSLVQSVPCL